MLADFTKLGGEKRNDRRVNDERLATIEAKIDKLSEAMLTLVRMEERMVFQAGTIERLENRIDQLSKEKDCLREGVQRVSAAENKSTDRSMIFERIIWILVSVAIGAVGLIESNSGVMQ